MSSQNKFAGSMGKVGDTASGGKSVQGGNVYKAPAPPTINKANSSTANNVIKMKTGPGDNMGANKISSHNDINAFTRGIKSRGPYGGPAFSSFNTSKLNMQKSNTTGISSFTTPSGSSNHRGTAGGSGTGMTKNSKVGSGKAVTKQMAKAPSDNKNGSGHQSGLGRKRA